MGSSLVGVTIMGKVGGIIDLWGNLPIAVHLLIMA